MRQLALLAIAAALLLSGCAAGGGELDATVRAVAPRATTRGPPPATAPPGAGSDQRRPRGEPPWAGGRCQPSRSFRGRGRPAVLVGARRAAGPRPARWAQTRAVDIQAAATGGSRPTTELVSLGANGQSTDPQSSAESGRLSADGRFIVFDTRDPGFVTGDTNGDNDVFVRDRRAARITRVSVGPGGREANDDSGQPSISADGRYVAFTSYASNLVPRDTNEQYDGFVHDRWTGRTERVVSPLADSGTFDVRISGDGRHVSFGVLPEAGNASGDLMVRDRRTGATRPVSVDSAGRPGNLGATGVALSADASVVAFTSDSTNLVAGDTNERADVFVHDLRTGHTQRVSVGPDGAQLAAASVAPALSAEGRHVSFSTFDPHVVPGDTNDSADVFVRDLRTGRTVIASVDADGRWPGADYMFESPSMLSADGRLVAFTSTYRLVPEDTNAVPDVYVRDLRGPAIRRVSIGARGEQSVADSYVMDLSADGRSVSFSSHASNLVPVGLNESGDIFVHGPRHRR